MEIRLIGELSVRRQGRPVALPASKKTRALLGYLVATGKPQRREHLCDLLWEGPHDPRSELRWSLSKIRPILNDQETFHLKSDRDRVRFDSQEAWIDFAEVRRTLPKGTAEAKPEDLKTALKLLNGVFLDGLDLPTCYRFQEWCMAEREAISKLRLATLGALIERSSSDPEEGLVYARTLVASDPLSESGHAAVVRLLGALGRRREAIRQYDHACEVLERELSTPLSGALEGARRSIGSAKAGAYVRQAGTSSVEEHPRAPHVEAPPRVSLVGRQSEKQRIDQLITFAANGEETPVFMLSGEPGIGKSRLLAHLIDRFEMIGGQVLFGRGFEAETARPFGAWIDALRSVPIGQIPDEQYPELALLRSDLGPVPNQTVDQSRLFDAVAKFLKKLAADRPIAVVLDDLQWLDEASSSLFHFVARVARGVRFPLIACAARETELADNRSGSKAVQELSRAHLLEEHPLGPLGSADIRALVSSIDPTLDGADIFDQCEGNPLFAVELSQARRRGGDWQGSTIETVISAQLDRLSDVARDLMTWAAALGGAFNTDLLMQIAGLELSSFLTTLNELERQGIVRPHQLDSYDFRHDLVRQSAYRSIALPRRRLVHRHISRCLADQLKADDSVSVDLTRHASLCGDDQLAARACVAAGERCMRLFANGDADGFADLGQVYVGKLPTGPLQVELKMGLLRIKVLAASGPGMRTLPSIAEEVLQVNEQAEALGLHGIAATGYYLLSVLHQEAGNTIEARRSTVRAAETARGSDRKTQADQLANTARCLLELESDVERARNLIDEAQTLSPQAGSETPELPWAQGLLCRWDGQLDEAADQLELALGQAQRSSDRWREYKCLTWLALTEFERHRFDATKDRCREILDVASRLGEEEGPFAEAILALIELAADGKRGSDRLDEAVTKLRAVDDKSYLAYVLNAAAVIHVDSGDYDRAYDLAVQAQQAATAVGRQSEATAAEALLALCDLNNPKNNSPKALVRLISVAADRHRVSVRVRTIVEHAASLAKDRE